MIKNILKRFQIEFSFILLLSILFGLVYAVGQVVHIEIQRFKSGLKILKKKNEYEKS